MAEIPSILKALSLLNKGTGETPGVENAAPKVSLPTTASRAALTKMVNGTPKDYENANLRVLLQDLLNWSGENKVNKPLIRAYGELLKQPQYYTQLVEFTGFAMAVAPLLEADHLVNLLQAVPNTKTAFSPTLYTLNFHSNVKRAFADLSTVRVEKIAHSLWEESHRGRWWNITAGVENVQNNQGSVAPSVLLKSLKDYEKSGNMENIIWSPENQEKFSRYMSTRLDQDIARLSEKFRTDLMEGKAVTPDIAIFLTSIPWLAPSQRPESPINSLLRTIAAMREDENIPFRMPKKPNSIKDMFPNLIVGGGGKVEYPFFPAIMNAALSRSIINGVPGEIQECNLIVNHNQLANNAQHMGNCTLTYERNMKQGTYALFYFKTDHGEYNMSVVTAGGNQRKWHIGELNSRHNRGDVPRNFREALAKNVEALPPVDEAYLNAVKEFVKDSSTGTVYSYTL